jgi:hypothetical protein
MAGGITTLTPPTRVHTTNGLPHISYHHLLAVHEVGHKANHDRAWNYRHDADDNDAGCNHGLPPLTYHDHLAFHEVGHKVYHNSAWKYHHDDANNDGGTTMDYILSPLTYHDHVVIHEAKHNAYHDDTRKYHHAAAEGGYHREPMNKMIKKTSETGYSIPK